MVEGGEQGLFPQAGPSSQEWEEELMTTPQGTVRHFTGASLIPPFPLPQARRPGGMSLSGSVKNGTIGESLSCQVDHGGGFSSQSGASVQEGDH